MDLGNPVIQFSSPEKKDVKEAESNSNGNGQNLKRDKPNYLENIFIISSAIDSNIFLNSNKLFEDIVNNFKLSKRKLGARFIEKLTGYSEEYIKRNIRLPEFKKELKQKIDKKIEELKKEELIDKDGALTDKSIKLAAVELLREEVDKLSNSTGSYESNEKTDLGIVKDFSNAKPRRFADISVKKTLRVAVKRMHKEITKDDLRKKVRGDKGSISIIFALDSSASMKGEKLREAKRAGAALIYKAIKDKNRVGLIIFRNEVVAKRKPSSDIYSLIEDLVRVKPKQQTDISLAIEESIKLLSNQKGDKYIILITDLQPTKGDKPLKRTMRAVYRAVNLGIKISIVGINLKGEAIGLAQKIVDISQGRLYLTKKLNNLDSIILVEYDKVVGLND